MDWNTALQLITLIVAVLSPVLVTLLNNRHYRKLEEQKYRRTTRRELIEKFSTDYAVLLVVGPNIRELVQRFVASAYNVVPLLNGRAQNELISLINTVRSQCSAAGTDEVFISCIRNLLASKL